MSDRNYKWLFAESSSAGGGRKTVAGSSWRIETAAQKPRRRWRRHRRGLIDLTYFSRGTPARGRRWRRRPRTSDGDATNCVYLTAVLQRPRIKLHLLFLLALLSALPLQLAVSLLLFFFLFFLFLSSRSPTRALTFARSLPLYLSLLFLRALRPPFPIYTSVRMAWPLFHPNRDDRKHGDLLPRSQLNGRRFSRKRRPGVCQRSTQADGCSAAVSPGLASVATIPSTSCKIRVKPRFSHWQLVVCVVFVARLDWQNLVRRFQHLR